MKDKMAVLLSGICLVHCFLPPLIISIGIMGFAGELPESEWVHLVLLFPVITLALFSLPASYRGHRSRWPTILAAIGITGLSAALIAPEALELWMTVPAAILMIIAHSWNSILLQRRRHTIASPQVLVRAAK
jgi:hypothetical protein